MVDDIEVNRIILVKILSTLGTTCYTAVNGQDAVMDAHIAKPVQIDTLKATIQQVMNSRCCP